MPEKLTKHRLNSVYAKPAHSIVGRAAGTNGAQARAPGRAAGASQLAIRRAAAAIRRQRRKRGPTFQPAPLSVRSSSPGFPDSASESRYPTRPAARPPGAGGPSAAPDPWPVLSPHCRGTRRGPSRFVRPCAGLPAKRVGGKALIGPSSNSRRRRGARSRAPAHGTRHGARLAGRGTSQVSGHYSDG